jgi:hypothetical protein
MLYWPSTFVIRPQFSLEKQALIIKPTTLICLEEEIALLVTKNHERWHIWEAISEIGSFEMRQLLDV